MTITRRSEGRDRVLSPKIAAAAAVGVAVATSLALLVQPGQAFHTNMLASGALRRASASAVRRAPAAAAALPRRLATNRCGPGFSMAWEDDDRVRRRGRQVDRGFSSGGVVDKSLNDGDSTDSYGGGGGSGGRVGGGWADADGGDGGGSGSSRQQKLSDGRGRGGGDNYRNGGGSRGEGAVQGVGVAATIGISVGGRAEAVVTPAGTTTEVGAGGGGGRDAVGAAPRTAGGKAAAALTMGERGHSGGGETMQVVAIARTIGRLERGLLPLEAVEVMRWRGGGLGGVGGVAHSDTTKANYQAELSPTHNVDEDTNFDMVYGIAPVLNVLRNNRREKLGLYCQDGLAPANKKDRAAANRIYDIARETDVPMTTTDKGYLNTLCGNRPHQGFILKARPLKFEPILFLPRVKDVEADPSVEATATAADAETSPEHDDDDDGQEEDRNAAAAPKKPPAPLAAAATGQVWLALDEVTDPQNFGALLRSAHFFGASGVVACAKNSAALTATVSKSSAGAVEVMRVHSTANMMRFLKRSRENGWRVVGTSVSERSGPLHELPAGPGAPPTIVVLGNEGYGVRTNVLRECDFLVEVAGDGGGALAEGATPSTVDSLNVSVTGGVVLFHLLAGAKHAAAYAASSD
ncbi:unnamed protein product [Ectocarpus sp. CCAP 1310/34]|nr:unnamed protein product [Ectocarpus sp. CCAP 1310/34]